MTRGEAAEQRDEAGRFLMIVRYFARKLSVNARDIENTLFVVRPEGRLYASVGHRGTDVALLRIAGPC